MRFRVRTFNSISPKGLERLPPDRYEVGPEIARPDAILLRSADIHQLDIPRSVLAVARAGAGTNNIPVSRLSQRGVPVFNAPGANANAVKELVLAGLFLGARHIGPALDFVRSLEQSGDALEQAVEEGKKRFIGHELPGRVLGVIGLGAIGVEVANAAHLLGMHVLGYDPQITVQRAWQLSSGVGQALSLEDIFARSHAVTVLNFARSAIVDEPAVIGALRSGRLAAYVCDFPSAAARGVPGVVALPHLGASTSEAEENCAMMVADTLRDFLEHGNVRHSVNFPEAALPRVPATARIAIANSNVPNMVGQISTRLAEAGLNIADLLNKSKGELAYTLIDIDGRVPAGLVERVASIQGVLSARAVQWAT
jgi:D-3-phosphoglycerate dehydrogenase